MNSTAWDIDLASGHIAHPSGLHAYISSTPEESGAIRCIGPFSSHKNNLRESDVFQFTADAIHAIETLEPFRDCFTYWGSVATSGSPPDGVVTILGESFGFIPNPCFRSELLLRRKRSGATSYQLSREWIYDGVQPQIDHRLGYKFSFPPDQQKRTRIQGEVSATTEHNSGIQSVMRPIMIKTLGSLAVAVLDELGHQFPQGSTRKLRLRLHEALQ